MSVFENSSRADYTSLIWRLSLSSPPTACLTIADRAKLNSRRRDIGFVSKSNSNVLDILRHIEKPKRGERSRNNFHQNEVPIDVARLGLYQVVGYTNNQSACSIRWELASLIL